MELELTTMSQRPAPTRVTINAAMVHTSVVVELVCKAVADDATRANGASPKVLVPGDATETVAGRRSNTNAPSRRIFPAASTDTTRSADPAAPRGTTDGVVKRSVVASTTVRSDTSRLPRLAEVAPATK